MRQPRRGTILIPLPATLALLAFLLATTVLAEVAEPETGQPLPDGVVALDPGQLTVEPLVLGQARPFQARMSLSTPYSRIHGLISWQAPDRRAMVVLDHHDFVPLMIAVDGRVLFFDVVTGF